MSRSATITIKTDLEAFEFHAGTRAIPEALSMRVGETQHLTGREAFYCMRDTDFSTLGHVRANLIADVANSYYNALEYAQEAGEEVCSILTIDITYMD